MFRKVLKAVLMTVLLAACATGNATQSPATETSVAAQPSAGQCGDGVCEGPENTQNCPEDCAASEEAAPVTGDACLNPNPQHAVISEELTEWHNWLDDGGFEDGTADVVVSDHSVAGLSRAAVERLAAAARSGSYGYAITAGPGQGVTFAVRAYVDKGEDVRFSFWARSLEGSVELQPVVYWVELDEEDQEPEAEPLGAFTVGQEWTQVSAVTENTRRLRYALLNIEVGPETTLYVDDMMVEGPIWRMAEYPADVQTRIVGGIPVPAEPVAPLYFTVLIHIEDPPQMFVNEQYFRTQTAIFHELARVLHEHGGFLTIQPEEDWPMASETWQPGLLADLSSELGVVYSTHTHGPHCRDLDGRLRSLTDCNTEGRQAGWDQEPNDYQNPWVTEYVQMEREMLERISGTTVTDHNGNWEFADVGTLADVGVLTWSSFKDHVTQRTYDVLINNPWRPTACNPEQDTETFLTHDPDVPIIYIPGWSQVITRWDERLSDLMPPLTSQFIHYVSADRVNTFYIITHIGTFHARNAEDDDTYIVYDPASGEMIYSEEFLQDLQYWDDMLTELIDPLVAEGYIQWASLPEMGELYVEWEAACAGQ